MANGKPLANPAAGDQTDTAAARVWAMDHIRRGVVALLGRADLRAMALSSKYYGAVALDVLYAEMNQSDLKEVVFTGIRDIVSSPPIYALELGRQLSFRTAGEPPVNV
jgi:hypothetical protein